MKSFFSIVSLRSTTCKKAKRMTIQLPYIPTSCLFDRLLFGKQSESCGSIGQVLQNVAAFGFVAGFSCRNHDQLAHNELMLLCDCAPRLANDTLGSVSFHRAAQLFRSRDANAVDDLLLRMALLQKTGMLVVKNKQNDPLADHLFSFIIGFHKKMVFI